MFIGDVLLLLSTRSSRWSEVFLGQKGRSVDTLGKPVAELPSGQDRGQDRCLCCRRGDDRAIALATVVTVTSVAMIVASVSTMAVMSIMSSMFAAMASWEATMIPSCGQRNSRNSRARGSIGEVDNIIRASSVWEQRWMADFAGLGMRRETDRLNRVDSTAGILRQGVGRKGQGNCKERQPGHYDYEKAFQKRSKWY